ncbi:MAG: DMT family transporter [Butyricicoccus sp.]|nr:DMT family transporter [Butyricicoccus sp.]
MNKQHLLGHAAALGCELVWGTTFTVTKILQDNLAPIEILFLRFVVGYLTLFLLSPRRLKLGGKKRELLYSMAGLTGVVIYFLLENYAVHFTLASNVGVIVSVCPFFTALCAWAAGWNEEKPGKNFFVGFLAAMAGIVLINWNGLAVGGGSLLGDGMTIAAAFMWAVYSLLSRKITDLGESVVQSTRHIFLYGLLWMLPCLPAFGFSPSSEALTNPGVIGGLLFLGAVASGICFVLWNFATARIGAVQTAAYIYLAPVISVVTSALFLDEKVTLLAAAGTVLTLFGLILSEGRFPKAKKRKD